LALNLLSGRATTMATAESLDAVTPSPALLASSGAPPAPAAAVPSAAATLTPAKGTAKVLIQVDIRSAPNVPNPDLVYTPGMTFNYDSYIDANGYRFLSYISYSGVRRYVAQQTLDGKTVYVSGGVPVPKPVNHAPTAKASVSAPNASSGVVNVTVTGTDSDGDALTYKVTTGPAKGTVTSTGGGAFSYTPTANARQAAAAPNASAAAKKDSFTVTVSDGKGGSASVAVNVAVQPTAVNHAPTAKATVEAPNASSGAVKVTIAGSDFDGDALTYTVATGPAKGNVTASGGGVFTYTPTTQARQAAAAPNASAADKKDTFTVTVSDGRGGTADVAVNVAVQPTATGNHAPTAKATIGTPNASSGAVKVTIVGADSDGGTLTYKVTTSPAKGTVAATGNGVFSYVPTTAARLKAGAANASAADKQDTFTVTVSDGQGGSVAVVVKVTVQRATVGQKAAAFVAATQGKHVLDGQCVDLIVEYLSKQYNVNTRGKGNASDYKYGDPSGVGRGADDVLAGAGFHWHAGATDFQDGDIIVWSGGVHYDGCDADGCGHIGIYYDKRVFDQNNKAHDPQALVPRPDLSVANYSGSFASVNGYGLVYKGYWRPPA
jgi:VCBS repeat-containing protein